MILQLFTGHVRAFKQPSHDGMFFLSRPATFFAVSFRKQYPGQTGLSEHTVSRVNTFISQVKKKIPRWERVPSLPLDPSTGG